ncbi:MAG: hypothetical protein HQK56_09810 [Deltaproteobacteria bacterium]|nr:hypothetical protein [Deltaproteobacteria bacterium]
MGGKMPADFHVITLVDAVATIVGIVSFIVTIIAFYASLKFYLEGQKLQENANKALIAIHEKSCMMENHFTGFFGKTLDAAIGYQNRQLQQYPDQGSTDKEKEIQQLMDVTCTPYTLKWEERIRQDLTNLNILTDGAVSDNTIKVLIRQLAAAQTAIWCERTYYYIYGSQIFLLQQLNRARNNGQTTDQIEKHFSQVITQYPDFYKGCDAQHYIRYLLNIEAIEHRDGIYLITYAGIEFLTWIAKTGRSEYKNY